MGATAELVGFQHDVGGTATVLDDCTIQSTDFSFDGISIWCVPVGVDFGSGMFQQ